MLSAKSSASFGRSMYTVRTGRRFMILTWPRPEPFGDEPETAILDGLERDDCPNSQKMIEETDDAA